MRRVVLSATTIAALIVTASCTAVTTLADGGRPGRSSAITGVAGRDHACTADYSA